MTQNTETLENMVENIEVLPEVEPSTSEAIEQPKVVLPELQTMIDRVRELDQSILPLQEQIDQLRKEKAAIQQQLKDYHQSILELLPTPTKSSKATGERVLTPENTAKVNEALKQYVAEGITPKQGRDRLKVDFADVPNILEWLEIDSKKANRYGAYNQRWHEAKKPKAA